MKVLLDATAIPSARGGVGRYVDALLPALVAEGVDVTVVCQGRDAEAMSSLAADAEVIAAPRGVARRPGRLAWEQVGLPLVARRVRADVLHSPHYTFPRLSPVPVSVTLHDATFFSHPELHSSLKGRFFRHAIRVAVRRADALIVPSAATGEQVRQFAGGDERKFHVAHHGVDPKIFRPADSAECRRVAHAIGVQGPYVAFLGTLEPRKNVPTLVRAWMQVAGRLADPPELVLAGSPGWDRGLEGVLAAVPPELTVRRPGYLPLADLAGLLAGAAVVVYPSLGEGFGLQVLEAMACGAAVLTTRELSLPEVGGDAVAYCGTDQGSIAESLGELLDNSRRREELAAAAVVRAAGFSWKASAAAHVDAFEAAIRVRRNRG